MTTEADIYEGLMPVFAECFPSAGGPPSPDTAAADVLGWDSMAHVIFISELEAKFGIEFEPEEITGFQNIGELVSIIKSKLKEN